MAVTPGNITIGTCTAMFDGVDLGATAEDVVVSPNPEIARIICDNYGKAPLGAIEAGLSVAVKVPLTERSFSQLAKLYDGSTVVTDGVTPTKQKLTMGRLVGSDLNTGTLVLHPQHMGSSAKNFDFTIYKAFIADVGDFSYSPSKQQGRMVTFEAMVDTSRADGDQLFCIGDTSATA